MVQAELEFISGDIMSHTGTGECNNVSAPPSWSAELSRYLDRIQEIEKAAEVIVENSSSLRRELLKLAESQHALNLQAESAKVEEKAIRSAAKARIEEWEKYHCERLAEVRDRADRSRSRSNDRSTSS